MTVDPKHQWWIDTAAKVGAETDLTNFKNWPVVRNIPLYRDNEFIEEYSDEVIDMLNASPWRLEWYEVLKLNESKLGHNEESWQRAQIKLADVLPTTGAVLKNMHHILTFESLRHRPVTDYDTIVEIGAGIGELARLVMARGFKGEYHVIDFPEIARLSSYTTEGRTIPHAHINELPANIDPKRTLLIATWSLSETPFDYRDEVGKQLAGCDSLILSQSQFKELDTNIPYFLNRWPDVNQCFYRLKQLSFHPGDGGNCYFVCAHCP